MSQSRHRAYVDT